MYHRILVGVDDTAAARMALLRAVDLVEAGHGRLGLLSSAPAPPPVASAGPVVVPVSRERLEQELLEWARRNVEEAASLVPDEVPITKLVTRGAPGKALLHEARTGCWDLVVVGQSSRRRRLFRSVGERLKRRSGVPVLVVHEEPVEPRRPRRAGLLRPRPRRRRGAQPSAA
jgi:nucleotide-binding universal stress UspA family protein